MPYLVNVKVENAGMWDTTGGPMAGCRTGNGKKHCKSFLVPDLVLIFCRFIPLLSSEVQVLAESSIGIGGCVAKVIFLNRRDNKNTSSVNVIVSLSLLQLNSSYQKYTIIVS